MIILPQLTDLQAWAELPAYEVSVSRGWLNISVEVLPLLIAYDGVIPVDAQNE